MPGAPIGVQLRVRGLRQRVVQRVPLSRRRRLVGRRAHRRVPEAHLHADLEQAGVDGRRRRLRVDAEPLGRAPHEQRLADGIGGRELHQSPGVRGQRVQAPPETLLEDRRGRTPEPAGQLRGAHAAREFQQRERVAARLGDQALADVDVEPPGDDGLQQGLRVLVAEPCEPQLRQAGERAVLRRLADREHDRDRLGEHPAGHEAQHLRRGAVEPLQIVHQAQHGSLLGGLGQQREQRQAEQEAGGRLAGRVAERDPQGIPLWPRERVDAGEQRRAELMQPGEGQLHLGLDAGDPGDVESGCPFRGMLHQHRLAHARLAADHEHAAVARACVVEEPVQRLTLAGTAPERRGARDRGHDGEPTDQGLTRARRSPDRGIVTTTKRRTARSPP